MDRKEQSFEVARRLKELRTAKKLSHAKLSAELLRIYGIKISRASLMNYEIDDEYHSRAESCANLKMNAEYLNCFADFYGVSTDYLLGRSDAKTADTDIQAACKTTGLSADAIEALKFDKAKKNGQDVFLIEDYLIKNFYVSFWATHIRNSIRNIAQIEILRSKLGADMVSDQTNFFKWEAIHSFESAFDKAKKEFSPICTTSLKIEDMHDYLAARKTEFEGYIRRIDELEKNENNLPVDEPLQLTQM